MMPTKSEKESKFIFETIWETPVSFVPESDFEPETAYIKSGDNGITPEAVSLEYLRSILEGNPLRVVPMDDNISATSAGVTRNGRLYTLSSTLPPRDRIINSALTHICSTTLSSSDLVTNRESRD